ncbi:MAG: phosphotransferase family protein [bacterium]|nr:phosphotransferase family protein [Gammaproteobacteria bacterium]
MSNDPLADGKSDEPVTEKLTQDEFEQRLAAVYRRQVPDFVELVSVDRLSGGASQETYRIVLRADSGEITQAMRRSPGGLHSEPAPGHPGLPTEARLMQCADDAGIPAPTVFYVLQASDGLGDGFIMQWLEGEALGARIVRSDKYESLRERLAYEIGKVVAKIHAIDLDATGLRDKLDVMSPGFFVQQTWDRYKLMQTPQPMIDYVGCWLMNNLPEIYSPQLVHNDFRNGNFMVSANEIIAVLDWEIAHIGDPMRDLGWICVNSWRFGSNKPVGGFGEYEDLFRGYEEVSGQKVDPEAVRFWEVFGSFWWSVGCLGFAEQYRIGPDKSAERAAIGRRNSECLVDCVNLLFPGDVKLIPAEENSDNLDVPGADKLLESVRDFLREEVMPSTQGRTNFLSRVASNSLDVVLREWQTGAEAKRLELARLQAFYGSNASLAELRWKLVNSLRDGTQALDDQDLQSHLRQTVVNQIAIDQPRYSGFKTAIGV